MRKEDKMKKTNKIVATLLALGMVSTSMTSLAADDIKIFVDDKQLECPVNPIIENERTLVPMRAIFEALGAKVDWDGETRTAILTSGEKTIKVQINSSIMLAGGKAVELDCPAKIIEGRTMVPIRAISESFKKKVFWDPKGLIVIGDNDKPFSSGDEYDGYLVDFLISYVDIGK